MRCWRSRRATSAWAAHRASERSDGIGTWLWQVKRFSPCKGEIEGVAGAAGDTAVRAPAVLQDLPLHDRPPLSPPCRGRSGASLQAESDIDVVPRDIPIHDLCADTPLLLKRRNSCAGQTLETAHHTKLAVRKLSGGRLPGAVPSALFACCSRAVWIRASTPPKSSDAASNPQRARARQAPSCERAVTFCGGGSFTPATCHARAFARRTRRST